MRKGTSIDNFDHNVKKSQREFRQQTLQSLLPNEKSINEFNIEKNHAIDEKPREIKIIELKIKAYFKKRRDKAKNIFIEKFSQSK